MKNKQDVNIQEKVMGCWLGKTVGGTLGMPFEGRDGPHNVSFYDPVPTEMIANDDLDLQVLWACILDAMPEPRVDRNIFGQAWLEHVEFPWDEYGVAIRNLKLGLKPPLTGWYDNFFVNGMGAAIRSELWACLAPGNPGLAAKYAYEDACVDHADEGIWATVFLATLESLAFIESDIDVLLDSALKELPETSLVRRAVIDTRKWWKDSGDWLAVRKMILDNYGQDNFTDVTMNMAFIVLAWLASEGDFSKAICMATNCGKDSDCTAASLGAIMGIIQPDGIDEKWLEPIGRDLVVSPEITGINPPATLDDFTDMVLRLKERLGGREPECQTIPQNTAPFSVHVDAAFMEREDLIKAVVDKTIDFPEQFTSMNLPGVLADMNREDFKNDFLLFRYRLLLSEKRDVRLLFNSRQENYVWLNGKYCFGREDGPMTPSPHRQMLKNQYFDISLESGEYEVVAAVSRPDDECAEWIIIAADAETKQWIPDAFICKS